MIFKEYKRKNRAEKKSLIIKNLKNYLSFKCIKKILNASFYTLEDIKKYKKITKIEKKRKI